MQINHASQQNRGMAWGFLGVVLFAMTVPMMRLAIGPSNQPQLPPLFVAAGRTALAGVLSLFYLWWVEAQWPPRQDRLALLLGALASMSGSVFLSLALRQVDASHASVVIGLLPLVTAVFAAWFSRQAPSLGFWLCAGTGCALVLVFTVYRSQGQFGWADAWLLLSIVSAALGYVLAAESAKAMTSEQVLCWHLILALPLTTPLTSWFWPTSPVAWSAWGGFFYVTLFALWMGSWAWYRGLFLGGAVRVSQVQLIQPFLSLLFAVPILGEPLQITTMGFSLAVMAVVFIGRKMPVNKGDT